MGSQLLTSSQIRPSTTLTAFNMFQLLLLPLVLASPTSNPDNDCGHPLDCVEHGDGWHPDPYNCRKFWHCYGGVGQHYACRTDMLFDLRYNGVTMLTRLTVETGQSVEPAMRAACINQPLQPLPPRHHAVTKSRNVIYLGKEPILTRIIAGNIGTVIVQAMGTTSSVPMECCSQRDTEVPATMITTYIVGTGLSVMIATKIVNIILKEYMNDKYMN